MVPVEEQLLFKKLDEQIREQFEKIDFAEEGGIPVEERQDFFNAQKEEIISDFNRHVTYIEFQEFGIQRPPNPEDFAKHYLANGGGKAFRKKWNASKGRLCVLKAA
ncbi:MAG: hypothetical protein KAR00_02365 [Candidatus Pacebacteria bacterium]|nr:hypothetical protein [Candidatus Paceibacterota bacterium]